MKTTTTEPTRRILVWDLPTRVFHWSLALCFGGAFLTAESERYREIHVALGYSLLGLVVFRVVWGLIGSRYARFSSFPLRPAAVKRYVTSLLGERPEHHLGHNPAGSYAVLALLAFAAASSVTGYLTYNDLIGDEPHAVVANLMLALVVIHIAAVIGSSLLHRENLIAAMLTGFKRGRPEDGIPSSRWVLGTTMVAAIVAAFATLTHASTEAGATAAGIGAHPGERQSAAIRERDDDD